MSYNEDFDEEPEVIVKKKGGLLGKVVSLLLGVVIGAVGALGGTAGLGYYLATKKNDRRSARLRKRKREPL